MKVDLNRLRNLAGQLREQTEQVAQKRTPGRSWYRIEDKKSDDGSKLAEIFIYDYIGEWGVTAQDFVNDLRSLGASAALDLHVNSEGGEVFDGLAIYEALANHGGGVTAYVDGLAASSASFIICAAKRVVVAPRARVMIHDAHGLAIGNARDLRATADLLDDLSDNIADIYAERAGGTRASWREAMRAASGGPDGTWYDAQGAVKAGLADEVRGEESTRPPKAEALSSSSGIEPLPDQRWSPEGLLSVINGLENPEIPAPPVPLDALLAATSDLP